MSILFAKNKTIPQKQNRFEKLLVFYDVKSLASNSNCTNYTN